MVCENTHLSRFGGDVDLDSIVHGIQFSFLFYVECLSKPFLGSDVHIGGLVYRLQKSDSSAYASDEI